MSNFSNRSRSSAHRRDYVWQYEYYDDEEPVSFEGLKANRCEEILTLNVFEQGTHFYLCLVAFNNL